MSGKKVILVDGYNAIHQIPALKRVLVSGGLEAARQRLAMYLAAWRGGRQAPECVIVFDGDAEFAGNGEPRVCGIRCIFSLSTHGADNEIIKFVREWKGSRDDIMVVSDDNNVRNNCRAHGAAVQTIDFIKAARIIPSPTPARASSPNGKRISRKAAAEIDEELRKKFGV